MQNVLTGFSVVWILIVLGFVLGKYRLLGDNAATVLSKLSFYVANPALLFITLSKAHVHEVLGLPLLIAALSALLTAALYLIFASVFLNRSAGENVIGAMSSATVNAANLGLPIASYVLGNAALVAPVMIFQLAIFTPLGLIILDSLAQRERTDQTSFARTVARIPLNIVRNPMIIGAIAGLVVAATNLKLPSFVTDSLGLLGGASIPAVLLAFGLSLVGARPLQRSSGRRFDTLLATFAKLCVQPVIAYFLAHVLFGISGHLLFAVVVTAGLPSAQNIFVIAMRYRVGVVSTKDTVLLTTILAIPVTMVMSALLAA